MVLNICLPCQSYYIIIYNQGQWYGCEAKTSQVSS